MISEARKKDLGKVNFISLYGTLGFVLALISKFVPSGRWQWAWLAVPVLSYAVPFVRQRMWQWDVTVFGRIVKRGFFWMMLMGAGAAAYMNVYRADLLIAMMTVPLGCSMFLLCGLLRRPTFLIVGFWTVFIAISRSAVNNDFFSGMGSHSSLFYVVMFFVSALLGYFVDSDDVGKNTDE